MPEENSIPQDSKRDKQFNFSTKEGVIIAAQDVAAASFNQTIAVQNVMGCARMINSAIRLAELELRYKMFQRKYSENEPKPIALLD